MNYDWTRKEDLEELAEAVENSRTQGERDYYKGMMYRLLHETDTILYWREELLKAVRSNSRDRKQYCIRMIQNAKLDATGGKAWGNNKGGNRYAN